jgi:uncharacterized protein (DUF2141 family)
MVIGTANINNGDCNIVSEVIIQDVSCFGLMDGSISLEISGAVDPISYIWSNDSTTASISDLDIGSYSVTLTDANNCQVQFTDIEITEPTEITASEAIITDADTPDSSDGSIEIDFSGGTGNLTIEYTDGEGNDIGITSFENLKAGSYGVIVTDENGCEIFFGPYLVGFLSRTENINPIIANVFPNPANAFFVIETDAKLISNPILFSVSGQLIESTFEKNYDKYTYDSSKLPNGVYYIKLVSESDIALKKIIITQ